MRFTPEGARGPLERGDLAETIESSMANPYQVLGLPPTADDDAIRASYLTLVRRFPPEREAETFKKIQAAYEALRDLRARLRHLLFDPSHGETFEEWIDEIVAESRRTRLGLPRIRRMFGLS